METKSITLMYIVKHHTQAKISLSIVSINFDGIFKAKAVFGQLQE